MSIPNDAIVLTGKKKYWRILLRSYKEGNYTKYPYFCPLMQSLALLKQIPPREFNLMKQFIDSCRLMAGRADKSTLFYMPMTAVMQGPSFVDKLHKELRITLLKKVIQQGWITRNDYDAIVRSVWDKFHIPIDSI